MSSLVPSPLFLPRLLSFGFVLACPVVLSRLSVLPPRLVSSRPVPSRLVSSCLVSVISIGLGATKIWCQQCALSLFLFLTSFIYIEREGCVSVCVYVGGGCVRACVRMCALQCKYSKAQYTKQHSYDNSLEICNMKREKAYNTKYNRSIAEAFMAGEMFYVTHEHCAPQRWQHRSSRTSGLGQWPRGRLWWRSSGL